MYKFHHIDGREQQQGLLLVGKILGSAFSVKTEKGKISADIAKIVIPGQAGI